MEEEFKPGKYTHYKGGQYVALHLAAHHETGKKFVVYVSCTYGSLHLREWKTPGAGSWTDAVQFVGGEAPRFQYVGPA